MPSNSGALLPHSAAMLGVLYGALSHLARTSMCYLSASPFHPTTSWCCRFKPRPLLRIHAHAALAHPCAATRWNRHPDFDVLGASLCAFSRPLRTTALRSSRGPRSEAHTSELQS